MDKLEWGLLNFVAGVLFTVLLFEAKENIETRLTFLESHYAKDTLIFDPTNNDIKLKKMIMKSLNKIKVIGAIVIVLTLIYYVSIKYLNSKSNTLTVEKLELGLKNENKVSKKELEILLTYVKNLDLKNFYCDGTVIDRIKEINLYKNRHFKLQTYFMAGIEDLKSSKIRNMKIKDLYSIIDEETILNNQGNLNYCTYETPIKLEKISSESLNYKKELKILPFINGTSTKHKKRYKYRFKKRKNYSL